MKKLLIAIYALAFILSAVATLVYTYDKGYNQGVFETKCELDGGFIEDGFCYVYGE